MKDARPWKLYTPPGMCGDVMCVCHSIRRTDRDNAQLVAINIKPLAGVVLTDRRVFTFHGMLIFCVWKFFWKLHQKDMMY